MLCRKGNLSKQDIGVIRVFENETKLEIAQSVAEQFALNMRRPGGENIRVERVNDGAERGPTPKGPKGPKAKRPSKAHRDRPN